MFPQQTITKSGQNQSESWFHQIRKAPTLLQQYRCLGLNPGTHFHIATWLLTLSFSNGWIALDVFLKLGPRKYKHNAHSIIFADVLSRSNNLMIMREYL